MRIVNIPRALSSLTLDDGAGRTVQFARRARWHTMCVAREKYCRARVTHLAGRLKARLQRTSLDLYPGKRAEGLEKLARARNVGLAEAHNIGKIARF